MFRFCQCRTSFRLFKPKAQKKAKAVIYLYMNGAMSQIDTFDPKPDSDVQGDTGVIRTKIPSVQFGESLKGLASIADQIAVVRFDVHRGLVFMKTAST